MRYRIKRIDISMGIRPVIAVLTVVVLVMTVPIAVMTVPTMAATTTHGDVVESTEKQVTAEAALDAKQQAKRLQTRFQKLNDRKEVDSSASLLQSIQYHIEKGNLAFQTNKYRKAKQEYDIAINQSQTGLKRGYTGGAKTLLNASGSHLDALSAQGYTTSEMGLLRERIDKQRNRLQSVESLATANERYQDARALYADVQSIPAPWIVQIVSFVMSIWMLILLAVVFVIVGMGWYLRSGPEGRESQPDLH
jgi:hypothetical protein